jgi:hypothetical protein
MADEKRPPESKIRPAIELVIEVPQENRGKRRPVDELIQSALRQVPTDALADEQKVILVLQHNGSSPTLPPGPDDDKHDS